MGLGRGSHFGESFVFGGFSAGGNTNGNGMRGIAVRVANVNRHAVVLSGHDHFAVGLQLAEHGQDFGRVIMVLLNALGESQRLGEAAL